MHSEASSEGGVNCIGDLVFPVYMLRRFRRVSTSQKTENVPSALKDSSLCFRSYVCTICWEFRCAEGCWLDFVTEYQLFQ